MVPLSWQSILSPVTCFKSFISGHDFEAFPGYDEHFSFGAIWARSQLDDRGRDIGRGRRRSHALNEVRRGYTKIAGIARDYMLSELGVRNDPRPKSHKSQPTPKTSPFLLPLVSLEFL